MAVEQTYATVHKSAEARLYCNWLFRTLRRISARQARDLTPHYHFDPTVWHIDICRIAAGYGMISSETTLFVLCFLCLSDCLSIENRFLGLVCVFEDALILGQIFPGSTSENERCRDKQGLRWRGSGNREAIWKWSRLWASSRDRGVRGSRGHSCKSRNHRLEIDRCALLVGRSPAAPQLILYLFLISAFMRQFFFHRWRRPLWLQHLWLSPPALANSISHHGSSWHIFWLIPPFSLCSRDWVTFSEGKMPFLLR